MNSKGERTTLDQMERLLDRLVVPKLIRLKVGAQVMLVKNLVQGRLVNGSVGQVIGFYTSADAVRRHLEIAKLEASPDGATDTEVVAGVPPDQQWPLVRFTNGAELLLVPQEFTINNADGGIEAQREQVCA
ncbi:hypothetical protein B0H15DRAFT_768603 [Mycena belliarum]|uniref:DNA helicase Pif1-like 2B domain-containing protein n=1 Tax=Mycena belliarum TaxID=1033014 RepID=A0AAD6XVG0_9AGAR|nr:hypothetical protein B0H15DRAFT_768603 [Mycena belliae]